MSDETATQKRPFAAYTPADHAAVQRAATAGFLAAACHRTIVPGWSAPDGDVLPGIRRAREIRDQADRLITESVVAAYEGGATWEQIGRALGGITRQSAHERYAPAVAAFHAELAAALKRADRGQDPMGPAGTRTICNTDFYGPEMDQVATTEYPMQLGISPKPGAFLATLSDPATATPSPTGTVRGPDVRPPGCGYHTDGYDSDDDPTWLVCTLPAGHPGNHQLAVSGSEE